MTIFVWLFFSLSGNDILKKVDQAMKGPENASSLVKMTLIDSKGHKKYRTVYMWSKGSKRLMKFKSPAEVKGVGFLVLSDDEMYIYMPAFGKIRRIASHSKKQSFMGSDFSYNDMGNTSYSDDYNATLIKEGEDYYLLKLVPKNNNLEYSKILMYVNKENYLPDSSKFYDRSGSLYKVMRNLKVVNIKGYWIPAKISMYNIKKSHKTIMEMSNIKVDARISEKLFTKRNLRRPA